MLERFFPSAYAPSIADIDYERLYERGVRGLIFDIDNTIEGYGETAPSPEKAALLASLVNRGFIICFVSNNNPERVARFNKELGYPALPKAGKPAKRAVHRAAELMGLSGGESTLALIGDQVFTDIWCGNRCGVYTILVRPVTGYDPWNVALKRVPERWIIKKYMKTVE